MCASIITAAKVSNNGWSVEPHVAEEIFEKLIAKHKVEVIREARLASVEKSGRRIRAITLDQAPVDSRGAPAAQPQEKSFLVVEAAMFMDCSYEGDLLAGVGVSRRSDREGRDEFNESYGGVCYTGLATERAKESKAAKIPLRIDSYVRPGDPTSGLLPFVSATALAAGRCS